MAGAHELCGFRLEFALPELTRGESDTASEPGAYWINSSCRTG